MFGGPAGVAVYNGRYVGPNTERFAEAAIVQADNPTQVRRAPVDNFLRTSGIRLQETHATAPTRAGTVLEGYMGHLTQHIWDCRRENIVYQIPSYERLHTPSVTRNRSASEGTDLQSGK